MKINEYQTKRTIQEILDVETGDIINADDFFKKPESEIIAYRRLLQEAIAGIKTPKYKCAYCNQLLKLSGKKTIRGQVSFFAHLYDSEDCEIKTDSDITKEEIEIRKYSNIRESERHINLKDEIAVALEGEKSQSLGVKNVQIEKRITSSVPHLHWRQPDISAEIGNKKIVFELQLSTTFLSTIVDRDVFYRMHNIFIVWIFNFSENQEYVNLSNLMCKDIYYANKRNAFVFDEKAQTLSEKEGQLVLLSIWFEPFVENGIFNPEKSIRKEEYIRLSDLKYDFETFKPYYVDADSMFFKYQPELKDSYKIAEDYNIHRIKNMEERFHKKKSNLKKQLEIDQQKDEKIKELKVELAQNKAQLQRFQKKDKFGFELDGVEIIEAKYSEATDFSDNDYAKVKFNRKYGFINRQGDFVYECNYIEAFEICNNKCIVKYEKNWYILDLEKKVRTPIDCTEIKRLSDSKNILNIINKKTEKIFSGKNMSGCFSFTNQYNNTSFIISMEGNIIDKCLWYKVYNVQNGRLISQTSEYFICIDNRGNEFKAKKEAKDYTKNSYTGIVDIKGNVFIPFEYESINEFIGERVVARKNGKNGCFDSYGNIIIPFEYESIQDFNQSMSKANNNGKYGYIDIHGNIIIPFKYDSINKFIDGKAKARWNYKYGYIDEQGNTIIQFEYDSINEFIGGKAVARKNGKNGCFDSYGNIIIPFEYESIQDFNQSISIANNNGKYGCFDTDGNIIIPFKYESINEFIDGKAKAKWNNKYGYIDVQENTIIQFEYDSINHFIGGKAVAVKNRNYGYIDIQGKILIPFEYNEIEDFIDGRAKAMKNKKYGYIDEQGNTIIQFEYDYIYDFVDGRAKAVIGNNYYKGNRKYGYIDKQGKILIPFVYNEIEDFIDGRSKAMKNNKYGYIDEQGNPIIQFEYDSINEFIDGRAKAMKNKKYGYINEQGNTIIQFEYDSINEFIHGKAKARKDYKYGYLDKQGNTIIQFKYDAINKFVNGKAQAERDRNYGFIDKKGNELIQDIEKITDNLLKGEKFNKWGVEDKKKNIVIPFEYDEIGEFIDGKAKAMKNGKHGYLDEQGNTIIPFEYDAINEFVNGKAEANKAEKYGYIDAKGDIIIPFKYDFIDDFIDGKAIAIKNDKYGCLDEQGDIIIPFEYKEIYEFVDGKAIAIKNDKYGCLDIQGNMIIPFEYDFIYDFIDGKAKAKIDGNYGFIDDKGNEMVQDKEWVSDKLQKIKKFNKWGVQDTDGKTIIPFTYDAIYEFIDGKAKAMKNDKYGYLDEQGNTIIQFEYDSIDDFNNGKVIAERNRKFGFINQQGSTLLPFVYDSIQYFIDGNADVKKLGKNGIVDENGNGIMIISKKKIFKGRCDEIITEKYYSISDTQGRLKANYNDIDDFENGLARVYKNKNYISDAKRDTKQIFKVGCINKYGDLIIPCIFDKIGKFVEGKAEAEKDGRQLIIDKPENVFEQKNIVLSTYEINTIHKGTISNITHFGLFIVIEDGLTALLHISELIRSGIKCDDYNVGDEIEVKILSIDKKKNRVSLTLLK